MGCLANVLRHEEEPKCPTCRDTSMNELRDLLKQTEFQYRPPSPGELPSRYRNGDDDLEDDDMDTDGEEEEDDTAINPVTALAAILMNYSRNLQASWLKSPIRLHPGPRNQPFHSCWRSEEPVINTARLQFHSVNQRPSAA
jgi:hypothetical protein